jgi:hypothetical protein
MIGLIVAVAVIFGLLAGAMFYLGLFLILLTIRAFAARLHLLFRRRSA